MFVIRANQNAKDANNIHLRTKQTNFALTARARLKWGNKQRSKVNLKPDPTIFPVNAPISAHFAENIQASKQKSRGLKQWHCVAHVSHMSEWVIYHDAASAIKRTDELHNFYNLKHLYFFLLFEFNF